MEVIGMKKSGDNGLTEELWEAIVRNDASYDGRFIYAVETTGICCRPSCKSRVPNKNNVRVFRSVGEALSAGFRPCKRCKPTGEKLPDQEWVAQISACIDRNYNEALTLDVLADMCHGSPYHLHRTFKRIKGMTPVEYIQQTRVSRAIDYLTRSNKSVADIASTVGLPNTPYFITLFKKKTGHTPADFRRINRNGMEG
ncbi:methylphosphotriester-DNA--protein-cysteine methyltransferase family protein [Paenibacillus sp. IB182493]|uniref:Methylphosphotriester-DNA--protein-cysteine methyltransferase family protein n=2 Tax=Paenibacillus arenilitoris TaxID=2772299 RepID=A0A927CIF1_9BACL|nr:methylphosphotriester-DNA--protein-cysteine methyltransferase family protein [Paenibacillus arenilitoris]